MRTSGSVKIRWSKIANTVEIGATHHNVNRTLRNIMTDTTAESEYANTFIFVVVDVSKR